MSILRNAVALLGLVIALNSSASEINVITDRTDFHLKPLMQQFEAQTGIKINVAYVEEGSLVSRVAAKPTEADVVISTDSVVLSHLKREGLTSPLPPEPFKHLASHFKDSDYVALSYRVRSLVVRADMNVATPISYDDLANGKFRVCMRPLTHAYNINFVSQLIADKGLGYAKNWIAGVVKNLSMPPQGNDRKQGMLVAEGQCDVSLMNSYYFGLMLSNNTQRQHATRIKLYYPDQEGVGAYVLVAGAAITQSNKPEALHLIEFLLSPIAQTFVSHVNFEYPVLDGVALPVVVQGFAEGQPGVHKGRGKFHFIPLDTIAQNRDLAVEIVTKAQQ